MLINPAHRHSRHHSVQPIRHIRHPSIPKARHPTSEPRYNHDKDILDEWNSRRKAQSEARNRASLPRPPIPDPHNQPRPNSRPRIIGRLRRQIGARTRVPRSRTPAERSLEQARAQLRRLERKQAKAERKGKLWLRKKAVERKLNRVQHQLKKIATGNF